MRVADVTLEGRFVRLEPLQPAHVDALWPAADDPDVWRFMTARVTTREDLAAWVAARRAGVADGTALPFAQVDPRTRAAFGSTSLFDIDARHRRMEIGHTWIGASHRGTRANAEAKRLLLAHAFDVLGANRVQLKTDARNGRAQRAIEKLGAVKEGVLRRHVVLPDGFVRDSVVYSVIREEWPDMRARLDARLA